MKQKLVFLLLLLITIPAIFNLFQPGFFPTDDGDWMVIRFSAFHQALRDGQFPVRWLGRLNNGYGYPVANFLYPGFMYIGEFIHLIGFNFLDTIKILLAGSMIAGTFFSYLWLSKVFGKWESFVGAVLYTYTPYHLYDVYTRGSVGEVLALAVVPFILWQGERKHTYFLSVGIALLILSHNIMAVLFLPFILLYGFVRDRGVQTVISTFLGIVFSSFFWFPALYDLQYTVFHTTQVSEWRNYFSTLQQFGYLQLGIVTATFLYACITKKIIYTKTFVLFMLLGFLSLFMSLSVSIPLWDKLPIALVQFPFRLLSLEIVAIAFLGALFISVLSNTKKSVFAIALVVITLGSAFPFMQVTKRDYREEGFYTTNQGTTTVKNEYMPKWVKHIPQETQTEKVVMSGGNIKDLLVKTNRVQFTTKVVSGDTIAKVNTIYFPGWKAYSNGSEVEINYANPDGMIRVPLVKGVQKVEVIFTETRERLLSDLVSLVSFIAVSVYYLSSFRKRLLK